jgi:hypothetical protein
MRARAGRATKIPGQKATELSLDGAQRLSGRILRMGQTKTPARGWKPGRDSVWEVTWERPSTRQPKLTARFESTPRRAFYSIVSAEMKSSGGRAVAKLIMPRVQYLVRLFIRPLATRTAHRVEPTGTSSVGSGLDFFGGGPEYFRMSPFTWQDNELIPVLMAKPAE